MTVTENLQLELCFNTSNFLAQDLYPYPVILTWIKQLMPELLDQTKRSASLLEAIFSFLFKQKQTVFSKLLENELNEELYFCLLGLKSTLVDHSFNWEQAKIFLDCLQVQTLLPVGCIV